MKSVLTKFNFLCLLVLPILFFSTSCSKNQPPLKKLQAGSVILSFGDSLTFGTGAKSNHSYPALLQQLSGLRVVNAGVPGEVTAEGAKRLPDILETHQPALLILCHGGNDMLRKKPTAEIIKNLKAMIEQTRRRGIQIVLLGVPKPTLFSLTSADFYADLASEYNIPLEARIIPDVLGENQLKSDTIHPNAQGYSHIAKAVHKLLVSSQAL